MKRSLYLSDCPIRYVDEVAAAFAAQGFTAPTPIQAQAWPIALQGRDLIGLAETGSGKTYAYLLPAVVHAAAAARRTAADNASDVKDTTDARPAVLIIAPTRELAVQIDASASPFCLPLGLRHLCVYGGAPKAAQARALRNGVHLVVATPGRLADLVAAKACSLAHVTLLVLDEADRLLSMGFEPQIRGAVAQVCARASAARPAAHTLSRTFRAPQLQAVPGARHSLPAAASIAQRSCVTWA